MKSAQLERATTPVDPSETRHLTRGRFSRLTLLGAAFVGTLARAWADVPSALAGNVYCCNLRFPNGPWCGGTKGSSNFTCSAGHNKRNWTCCEPFGLVLCWECTTGATCDDPMYECSNYSFGASC